MTELWRSYVAQSAVAVRRQFVDYETKGSCDPSILHTRVVCFTFAGTTSWRRITCKKPYCTGERPKAPAPLSHGTKPLQRLEILHHQRTPVRNNIDSYQRCHCENDAPTTFFRALWYRVVEDNCAPRPHQPQFFLNKIFPTQFSRPFPRCQQTPQMLRRSCECSAEEVLDGEYARGFTAACVYITHSPQHRRAKGGGRACSRCTWRSNVKAHRCLYVSPASIAVRVVSCWCSSRKFVEHVHTTVYALGAARRARSRSITIGFLALTMRLPGPGVHRTRYPGVRPAAVPYIAEYSVPNDTGPALPSIPKKSVTSTKSKP